MTWEYLTDVASDTSPGFYYQIKRHPETGQLGCSCISFKFSLGTAKTCKHIEAYKLGEAVARSVTDGVPERVVKQSLAGETFTFRRAISFAPLTARSRP